MSGLAWARSPGPGPYSQPTEAAGAHWDGSVAGVEGQGQGDGLGGVHVLQVDCRGAPMGLVGVGG